MNVSAIAAQQSISSLRLTVAMVKSAHEAEQAIVNMVAASVDAQRGQNLDISV